MLHITISESKWFLPFVLPICIWAAYSDLRTMKIPNNAVLALVAVFVVIGLIALPFYPDYVWRFSHLIIVLLIGIVANATGLVGAGDAKFAAAAALFIVAADMVNVGLIFAVNLLACFVTHRMVKHSPLRRLAPDWESWSREKQFPMGFALGSTLVIYLALGIVYGS